MIAMRSLKNHPWVLVHSFCFLALAIHVIIIARNLLNPLHPHTYIKEESLQNVEFPVSFKICFKPAFKDDELLAVGYKNSWGYLTGVSHYNKSVVGWACLITCFHACLLAITVNSNRPNHTLAIRLISTDYT